MTISTEAIPSELAYQYEKRIGWLTKEERQVHYDERRNKIKGWTTPLNVKEVEVGNNPQYSNVYVDDDVIPSISIVGNTWVKQMIFEEKGDVHPGHSHAHDHQTLLAKGSVEVWANGATTEFVAPTIIYIKAGVQHGMIALEDETVIYCIHPLRDGEQVGDIIDPASVPNGVMPLVERAEKRLIPTDKL
jgi:quercetin dioxygenase-like cupin family protein